MNKPLLKQALDALIDSVDDSRDVLNAHLADWGESWRPERIEAMRKTVADTEAAIAALRTELAKPEPEPVAWRWAEKRSNGTEHWFGWTADWDNYQRAIDMGCRIEYAVPVRGNP